MARCDTWADPRTRWSGIRCSASMRPAARNARARAGNCSARRRHTSRLHSVWVADLRRQGFQAESSACAAALPRGACPEEEEKATTTSYRALAPLQASAVTDCASHPAGHRLARRGPVRRVRPVRGLPSRARAKCVGVEGEQHRAAHDGRAEQFESRVAIWMYDRASSGARRVGAAGSCLRQRLDVVRQLSRRVPCAAGCACRTRK
mmetsp:Transcript_37501/g.85078  ORF Transcript_37501/g.85078 Transcript_37501/m.85078 type:complete len:206 (-) Transcript_37501:587-1204(-)